MLRELQRVRDSDVNCSVLATHPMVQKNVRRAFLSTKSSPLLPGAWRGAQLQDALQGILNSIMPGMEVVLYTTHKVVTINITWEMTQGA